MEDGLQIDYKLMPDDFDDIEEFDDSPHITIPAPFDMFAVAVSAMFDHGHFTAFVEFYLAPPTLMEIKPETFIIKGGRQVLIAMNCSVPDT